MWLHVQCHRSMVHLMLGCEVVRKPRDVLHHTSGTRSKLDGFFVSLRLGRARALIRSVICTGVLSTVAASVHVVFCSQLPTMPTLCSRAAFSLYWHQLCVSMVARGRAMAPNAPFAGPLFSVNYNHQPTLPQFTGQSKFWRDGAEHKRPISHSGTSSASGENSGITASTS